MEQKFQRLSFTKDFEETLEQFTQIIEYDKAIKATIKEGDKKKGYFSPAIRFLIKQYVDANWPDFAYFKSQQPEKKRKVRAEQSTMGQTMAGDAGGAGVAESFDDMPDEELLDEERDGSQEVEENAEA